MIQRVSTDVGFYVYWPKHIKILLWKKTCIFLLSGTSTLK